MDIRQKYAVAETGRLHLRDATDALMYTPEGAEIAVNLYGPGSKPYAKALAAQQHRNMERLRRKGRAAQSADAIATEAAEFLADCTESFEHLDYDELTGSALARAVYADKTIGFVGDQVAKFLNDWANFSPVSTAT